MRGSRIAVAEHRACRANGVQYVNFGLRQSATNVVSHVAALRPFERRIADTVQRPLRERGSFTDLDLSPFVQWFDRATITPDARYRDMPDRHATEHLDSLKATIYRENARPPRRQINSSQRGIHGFFSFNSGRIDCGDLVRFHGRGA